MPTQRRRRSDREPLASIPVSLSSDPVAALSIEPSPDEIARRAYQLYEQRGGMHGDDWSDWFQAEQEMRARTAVAGV